MPMLSVEQQAVSCQIQLASGLSPGAVPHCQLIMAWYLVQCWTVTVRPAGAFKPFLYASGLQPLNIHQHAPVMPCGSHRKHTPPFKIMLWSCLDTMYDSKTMVVPDGSRCCFLLAPYCFDSNIRWPPCSLPGRFEELQSSAASRAAAGQQGPVSLCCTGEAWLVHCHRHRSW